MKIWQAVAIAASFMLILSGCAPSGSESYSPDPQGQGGGEGEQEPDKPIDPRCAPERHSTSIEGVDLQAEISGKLRIELDSELSPAHRSMLQQDLYRFMNYEVQVDPANASRAVKYYSKIFGGTTTEAAVRYLDERVRYIIPENINQSVRISLVNTQPEIEDPISGAAVVSQRSNVVASNLGVAIWLQASLRPNTQALFALNDKQVLIDSSRVGIMQLGGAYTDLRTGCEKRTLLSSVDRASTLIHEARHSDCTGGITQDQLEGLFLRDEVSESITCGHLHEICPRGHDLAGIPACDKGDWGAYAVEGVYAAALNAHCVNCNEQEKQAALIGAVDSISRVVDATELFTGKLGDPDMSSQGITSPATP